MSAAATPFPPTLTPSSAPTAERDVPRTLWQQVLRDTVRSTGARFGLSWIFILVIAAVFAPLLANSEPVLIKIDGRLSSPLVRHLTSTDVILLVLAAGVLIALCLFWVPLRARLTGIAGVLLVTIPLSWAFVSPPQTVDWQEYRDLQQQGKIQWKLMAVLPYSPNDFLRDQPDAPLNPPSRAHPLGTEANGGDVLSRMLHASRIALAIGVISVGISLVIGIVVGGLMGYFVGAVDLFGMRLIEIFEAIPPLFLLITFVAFFGRNLYMMMVIIGVTGWTGEARFIRAEFLRLRKQDFVYAGIASGLPLRSLLFRHLLPNGLSPVLVSATFGFASAILYESTLSFLGIGLIEEPSWGQLLNQALGVGGSFIWWIAIFPGLAIFLTVFSYNLLGEALRDALDPKLIR
jgi:peptide/nickel transport system permease protein